MGGTTRTLSYQYDAAGGRTRITHPDGAWFGILRDGLDRPFWLYSDPAAGVYYSSYRPDGLPAGQSRGNGAATWTSRDGVQRFNGLGHYYGGGTPADVLWLYQHNPAGQIASATRDNDAYAWTGHYAVNRNYTTNGLNQHMAPGEAGFGSEGDDPGALDQPGERVLEQQAGEQQHGQGREQIAQHLRIARALAGHRRREQQGDAGGDQQIGVDMVERAVAIEPDDHADPDGNDAEGECREDHLPVSEKGHWVKPRKNMPRFE